MSTKYRTHSEKIIEAAVNDLFPIREPLDPRKVEGYLTGVHTALQVTGYPKVDKDQGENAQEEDDG